jgi:LacI family transcriptional regulator
VTADRTGNGRPDIRQVAAEAGVSTATVSRVLSGRGPASSKAIRAVRSAAKRLNYQPSASASSLRTDRSMIIGVLVPNLANPVFLPFLRAVEHQAQRFGYAVMVADTQQSTEIEHRQLDRLSAQRIDALIMAGRPRDPERVRRLSDAGLAVADPVTFAERAGIPFRSISAGAIEEACRHLASLGHERLAFLARGHAEPSTSANRWRVIETTCRPLALAPFRVAIKGFEDFPASGGPTGSREELAATLDALMRSPGRPTVIWSNSHVLAPMLLEGMALADIGIPTDCSFVTFGDSSWAAAYRPSISVITDDLDAAATALTSSVLHQLGVTEAEAPVAVPLAVYLARKSVGPPPPRT